MNLNNVNKYNVPEVMPFVQIPSEFLPIVQTREDIKNKFEDAISSLDEEKSNANYNLLKDRSLFVVNSLVEYRNILTADEARVLNKCLFYSLAIPVSYILETSIYKDHKDSWMLSQSFLFTSGLQLMLELNQFGTNGLAQIMSQIWNKSFNAVETCNNNIESKKEQLNELAASEIKLKNGQSDFLLMAKSDELPSDVINEIGQNILETSLK